MSLNNDIKISALAADERLRAQLKRQLFRFSPNGGALESLALRLGLMQNSAHPEIKMPTLLIFAADHGIQREFSSELISTKTEQKVLEFLHGQGAASRLSAQNKLIAKVVDVGVNHSFEGTLTYWLHHGSKMLSRKVAFGTQNFWEFPAMTTAQMEKSFQVGIQLAENQWKKGSTVLGLSSLGEGRFFSATALCSALMNWEINADFIEKKTSRFLPEEWLRAAQKALRIHPKTHDPFTLLTIYGGLETAAMCGAVLKAAEKRMLVLLDGFVELAALLTAFKIDEKVLDYVQLCQHPDQAITKNIAEFLKLNTLLPKGAKGQEGSGVALALPFVRNSAALLNQR